MVEVVKGSCTVRSFSKAVPFLAALLFARCGGGPGSIDPEGVEVDLPIGRLDRAIFETFGPGGSGDDRTLRAEYGTFYTLYVEDILQAAPVDDPRLPLALGGFAGNPDWRSTQEAAEATLGDLSGQRKDFEEAFARLKAVFPDRITPRLVAYNSGYNYGIYPTDSVLGFGVEWFIGADHPVIGMLAPERFPRYLKDRMRPELLVPSVVKGWLMVHYMPETTGDDLLTHLVQTGKAMALLDVLLPDTPSDLKFAFTQEQLSWCEANEFRMWRELVDNELLFSDSFEDIGRIMNDGPFTPGFPRESPGHVGEWIGWRMVRAYLDQHPDTSWPDLLAIDPQSVLKSYKPR